MCFLFVVCVQMGGGVLLVAVVAVVLLVARPSVAAVVFDETTVSPVFAEALSALRSSPNVTAEAVALLALASR